MKNLNKMKIAGDMQFEIGQDKVNHFPTWEVKDDETLRKKVENLKRSTFDKSKFTVVGSPTITDDGVASGFSGSNRIETIILDVTKKNYCVKLSNFEYKGGQTFVFGTMFSYTESSYDLIINDNKLGLYISSNGTDWDVANLSTGSLTLTAGTIYDISFIRENGNKYKVVVFNHSTNIETTEIEIDSELDLFNSNFKIILGSVENAWTTYTGSIDLKQFSITVDGVEVFSGNKTGMDVIKPDNYTVVGSPMISDDGVASGFSKSNYIINGSQFNQPKDSIKIVCDFVVNDSSAEETVYSYGKGDIRLAVKNTYVEWLLRGSDGILYPTKYLTINDSDNVHIETVVTKGQLNARICINNNDIVLFSYSNSAIVINNFVNKDLYIGLSQALGFVFTGSIDLNAFKIYVDGNLVYRPCLKIPYTQSKTGSKIVDVAYRDRVQDLFEQVGYNGYFTLGENDFTLPTHKFSDVIDCYENGINKWEQRVDRTLRQQGSCTAGTEVALLKPYTDDENYALSVPYSAKTASSFIPTVTGDWFAEGKITL